MDGTKMPKIKVVYDPIKGDVVPDGEIGEYIDNWWMCAKRLFSQNEKDPLQITIGSETILYEMRARHKEGSIILDEEIIFRKPRENCLGCINYEFQTEDIILILDKNGRINRWPEGFCDVIDKALMRLLT